MSDIDVTQTPAPTDAGVQDPWLARANPGGNAPVGSTQSSWANDLLSQASDASYRADQAARQKVADQPLATLGAAVTTSDNSIVSIGRALFNPEPETNTPNSFNVPEAIQNDHMWDSGDYLMKSTSQADYEWRKSVVQSQQQAQDVLQHSGIGGTVAKLAIGALDPIYLLPGLGEVAAEGRIAKFAANAAGFTAINYGEAKVKDYQTGTDDANFMGAALSSLIPATLMGVGGMLLKPSAQKAMTSILTEEMGAGKDAGAALNKDLTGGGLYDADGNLKWKPIGEGTQQVTNLGTKTLNLLTPNWLKVPLNEALNNASETVRKLAGAISGNSNMTADVAAGKATADLGLNFNITKRVAPEQAALIRGENIALKGISQLKEIPLEHYDQVITDLGNIGVNGDFGVGGESSLVDAVKANWQALAIQAAQRAEPSVIPAIEAAASRGRAIYQKSWAEAVQKGLAEGNPEVAPQGWGVTLDKDKVIGSGFQSEVAYGLQDAAKNAGEALTGDEARQMANQWYNVIRDTGTVSQTQLIGKLNQLQGIGGKLSKLVVGLDPSITAKYAVDGYEKTVLSHLLYTSRQFASHDVFKQTSWDKILSDVIAPMRDKEIAAMREAGHDPDMIKANEEAHSKGMKILSRMYDEAMGLNDKGHSWAALRALGALTNMSSLGAAPLTLGTAGIMTGSRAVGMANLMGEMGRLLTDGDFSKFSREDNEIHGIATELAISGHLHADANSQSAMNSLTLDDAMQSAKQVSTAGVANALQKMADKFQFLTGAKWTVDQFRQAISNAANIKMIKMARSADKNGFDKLALIDKQFLGTYSMSPEMLQRVADEVKSNPDAIRTFDGHEYADTTKWKDQEAAYAFDAARLKVSHTAFHSIQPGNLPPIFDNQMGRTIFKFMSFVPAMHQQFLIAGLQGDKAALATSVIAGAVLGALNVRIREALGGHDPSQPRENLVTDMTGWDSTNSQRENLLSLLASGILKTGSGGIPQAILEHVVPFGKDLLGEKPDTGKFLTDMMGPTGSEIAELGNSVIDMKKVWDGQDLSESQIKRGLRGITGANLYGVPLPYILGHDMWHENNYWKNLQSQITNPLGGPQ